ncbi:hypothetical protein [Mycolicibacterium mengxianglii]|uniref:hypothetical protein n=1 Tax=Mycolicibacterium mengxianglii TaxID=2736649 RepID=UPI0018D1025E|nr:hypothetical protein [Mycolicibacterium mengxianglii]
MSDIPEHPTQPVVANESVVRTAVEHRDRRSSRVVQAAAWVGIVAGTVFVVAVIFFSGFILGRHSDGGGHSGGAGRHHGMMFGDGGPGAPMMPMRPGQGFGPGGPDGPGGPGMYGPGQEGSGPAQPNQPTSPGAPTPTTRP